ncbi:hypothetical protein P8452_73861 [Trifolium repens]|nr:hypothetical protein P8452_73861 [Trifolium repens]
MNIEMETHAGTTVETTTNEEQQKGWRKVLERLGDWLSYKDKNKWLEQMRGNLSLMATVIATMTFQMALNPTGGVRSIKDEANPPDSKIANTNAPASNDSPFDALCSILYSRRLLIRTMSGRSCLRCYIRRPVFCVPS